MIIKIPQSSEYQRVMIEITGPNVHRCIEASTDVAEVTPRLPNGVCEDGLTVTARFLNEAREPMGEVVVLQKAKFVETEGNEDNEELDVEDYSDDDEDEVT